MGQSTKIMKVAFILLLILPACLSVCLDAEIYRQDCPFWKSIKLCTDPSYEIFMRQFCPKTCGFCSSVCSDAGIYKQYCPSFKSDGFCTHPKYVSFMTRYCSRTCGFCSTGPQTTAPPTPGPPQPLDQCGVTQVQSGRVISGVDAKQGAWPWQILMLYNGVGRCGGSLVAPNWVVTAAHCVDGRESNPSSFTIRVGEHDRTWTDGNEHTLEVSKVFSHPNYDKYKIDNDIALFKLSTPAKLGKYVNTVCLPSSDNPVPVGTQCYITGWGKIQHPGNMHHTLQQAMMPVISKSDCSALNTKSSGISITDNMVCAGHGGSSTISGCHGDSGGPFVCKTGPNGKWELHGAVSWGSPTCSTSEAYTVFARVTKFRSWIDKVMGNN